MQDTIRTNTFAESAIPSKKMNIEKRLIIVSYLIAAGFFIAYAIFVIYRVAIGELEWNAIPQGGATSSSTALQLVSCSLGLLLLLIPTILNKLLKINKTASMRIFYVTFVFFAYFLGEIHDFYFRVPFWDSLLHGASGIMLVSLGYSVTDLLIIKHSEKTEVSLLFKAVFAFCIAVTLGVMWEVFEFCADALIGTNMQHYALYSGESLIGYNALIDTMKDIILDVVGALLTTIVVYFSTKRTQFNSENETCES